MVEVGKRGANAARDCAQVGDHFRRKIAPSGKRLAFDVAEQADRQSLAVDLVTTCESAIERGQRQRRAQPGVALRDVQHGRVLRFQRLHAPAAVGDLQDASHAIGLDAEVSILVAAKFLERAFDAEQLAGNRRRQRLRNPRPRRNLDRFVLHQPRLSAISADVSASPMSIATSSA